MLLSQYVDAIFARIQTLSPRTLFLTLIFLFSILVVTNGISPYWSRRYQELSQNPFIDSTDSSDLFLFWFLAIILL